MRDTDALMILDLESPSTPKAAIMSTLPAAPVTFPDIAIGERARFIASAAPEVQAQAVGRPVPIRTAGPKATFGAVRDLIINGPASPYNLDRPISIADKSATTATISRRTTPREIQPTMYPVLAQPSRLSSRIA